MRIIDYFDQIRVINLPSRTDRLSEMTSELDRAGMPFTPGKVELFAAIRPDTAAGFETIGLHGGFLSHLAVLREARDKGLDRVLVLEDDLQLSRRFLSNEEEFVERLQGQPWDIVYLGHAIELPPPHAPTFVPYNKPVLLAHFYGVSGRILPRLVDFLDLLISRPPGHPDGGPMSIDGAFSTFRARNPDVVTLLINPNLGWQRSSRTDSHPLKWFDRAPGVREVVAAARRGKQFLDRYR